MSDGGGWIGVDLDGTLAFYDKWRGVKHIGKPIEPMVRKVKQLLAEGIEVRIFTARVSGDEVGEATRAILDWCEEHIGQRLRVTCEKDFGCITVYDDRCVQVEPNTGRIMQVV